MDLKNLQIIVDKWIKDHGVRYFDELTNMAQLTEEVGEVARIISRKYGEQTFKENEELLDLGEELADVFHRRPLFFFCFPDSCIYCLQALVPPPRLGNAAAFALFVLPTLCAGSHVG